MKYLWVEYLVVLLIIIAIMGAFVLGRTSVDPIINRVYVDMDSQLLSAIRTYHGTDADTIYIIGTELCLLRSGHTISALTGSFLRFYDDNYLTKEK